MVMTANTCITMGKQLSVRIDDDLEALMEAEKNRHEFEPSDSEIVRAALREYLEGNSNPAPMEATAN